MRKLLFVFALLLMSNIGWATCGSGYAHVLAIKLSKASGSDQTNYPIRLWGRDWRLATTANLGYLEHTATNSIGRTGLVADVQFCPDTTLTGIPLKYENVYYGATFGDFEFWVQQPTYHTATNDTIYLYIGNAAVSTSQQDLSMWSDVNYVAVYHYPNGSALDLLNSVTGTAATNVNTVTANLGDNFGGAVLNGTSNYTRVTRTSALEPTSALTLESYAWSAIQPAGREMISKPYRTSGWTSPFISYRMLAENTGGGPGRICMSITTSGTRTEGCNSSAVLLAQNWNYAVGTYDGSNIKTYVNGANTSTTVKTGSIDYNAGSGGDLVFGTATPYTSITYWSGYLDEQRISSDAKSADWIATGNSVNSMYNRNYLIDEVTYSKPVVRQFSTCTGASGTASCVMPFDVALGGTMVVFTACLDSGCTFPCPAMSNDSLGLVYTLRGSSDYTGTLQHYYHCLYTAPITAAGADTITIPTGFEVSSVVIETKGTGTASAVYTSAASNTTTPTLTATSPAADSLLICGTFSGQNGGPSQSTTPSDYFIMSTPQGIDSGDHYAYSSVAWGIVGAGSKSCQFNTGLNGEMVILNNSPSVATKRRPSQVY
jgi:hypothetical protein